MVIHAVKHGRQCGRAWSSVQSNTVVHAIEHGGPCGWTRSSVRSNMVVCAVEHGRPCDQTRLSVRSNTVVHAIKHGRPCDQTLLSVGSPSQPPVLDLWFPCSTGYWEIWLNLISTNLISRVWNDPKSNKSRKLPKSKDLFLMDTLPLCTDWVSLSGLFWLVDSLIGCHMTFKTDHVNCEISLTYLHFPS